MHTTLATLGRVHGASPVESMKISSLSHFEKGGWVGNRRRRAPPAGLGGPTGGFIIVVDRMLHSPPAGLGGPAGGIYNNGE